MSLIFGKGLLMPTEGKLLVNGKLISCNHNNTWQQTIAHRLNSVRRCDTFVELERGQMVAHDMYEQLLDSSPGFWKIAGSETLNQEL